MKTISAGTRVAKGYYFNTHSWTLHPVERDGDILRGGGHDSYVAVPAPIAFAAAPLMGAAFLMFLPLVGFIEVARAAVEPVSRLLGRSATEIAATLQPGLRPGEAHLAGKPADEKAEAAKADAGKDEPAAADDLGKLEKDIADRRSR